MKQIDTIAEFNADLFIRKHFSNLSNKDRMVRAMRRSIKDTIKDSLRLYEMERVNK